MNSFSVRRRFALLCVAGLSISACGTGTKQVSESKGANNTPSEAATTTVKPTTDDTDKPSSDDNATSTTSTTSTTSAPKAKASAEVTESGFSVYKDYDDSSRATAGAVIKNSGDEGAIFIDVVFSFKDAAGQPVGTQSSYVYAIDPDGLGYAEVSSVELSGEAATVDVATVLNENTFADGTAVPLTVSGVKKEEYGDGSEVNGTAKNTTNDVQDSVSVTCVLRSGDKIVGGASGYLDTMVPGASITWTADGPVIADTAECAGATSS